MKCRDCQFNLLCHAGRLDAWSSDQQHVVLLCPKCNQLSVGQHETMYIFQCEKRQLTEVQLAAVQRLIASGEITPLSSVQMDDTGPGLTGKLTLGFCLHCIDMWPPNTRNVVIKYLDENREQSVAALQEAQQHRDREDAVHAEEMNDGRKHDTCTSDMCVSKHSEPCEDE